MARINWGRAPGILTEEEEARQLIENQRRWKGYGKTIMDLLAPNQNLQPSAHDLARQTIEINRPLGYTGKQPGKGGAPTSVQMPNRQRVLNPEYARSQQFGVGRGGAPVRMPGRPALSDRYQQAGRGGAPGMARGEEDEFGFLDAMFLANLIAGSQGGEPPTPYGFAAGGGSRPFVSLPSLMRMS